mmetsp:Transcript_8228/g.20796  ORF Transcript_8228/g.20796 Transcript_8228/m.20796 type:complete len:612 (+) Transcript_8228:214-2049(+)|eukprot:CAMPEP_0197589722 /NCGR_PEP_ID=MMETSP1326-20131121/10571_1 /TAXON_ID=1155430 /ORGANISM="Genus nov. species nov., Strain RCC2288" /LENGTH=611 /DNA_ID=CAMNT_0043154691 /DNA_START=197 /DNA_END=2032 /DNA_ORIENTATION=-
MASSCVAALSSHASAAAAPAQQRSVLRGSSLRGVKAVKAPRAAAGAARHQTSAAIADPPAATPAGAAKVVAPAKGTGRKKVVVLGSGWGAISFVKALEQNAPYDVVLVSPRNYFLYTPLLPGAATGAVEERSIVEPIRRPIAAKGYKYFEASCIAVNAEAKTITCQAADASFDIKNVDESYDENFVAFPWHTFDISYDYLITAVGAIPNTFGVPGVAENCMFFKEIIHASKFRREVSERFERATLPDVPDSRIQQLLTFVVIGAGPTGVELAAELYDMVYQDISRMYPSRLMPFVSIKIVDLQEKILSAYDRRIAEYATDFFQRANIDCLLNKQVNEVKEGVVVITDKATGVQSEVPFGLAVWCTGIKLNPLCEKIIDALPEGSQQNRRSLACDKNLRVKGSAGTIWAIGDCATIERPKSMAKAEELFAVAAKCEIDLLGDSMCEVDLDKETLKAALSSGKAEFPHLEEVVNNIDTSFETYAVDGRVNFPQFKKLLTEVDNGLRAYPATAQVAKQEAEHLAAFFNTCAGDADALRGEDTKFEYVHKGSLAYIGKDAAVADIPGFTIVKGVAAGLIWKGFETISQVSLRNVFLVAADMVRTKLFGRDISRFN